MKTVKSIIFILAVVFASLTLVMCSNSQELPKESSFAEESSLWEESLLEEPSFFEESSKEQTSEEFSEDDSEESFEEHSTEVSHELSVEESSSELSVEESSSEPSQEESSEESWVEPDNMDFVRVTDYIPNILVELKYATPHNFTGKVIYNFTDAYLLYGTVKKLAVVQSELEKSGYSLKIWDAYRPLEAQFVLWEVCPDSTFVTNPNTGVSSHSKGTAIDLTLVDKDGNEIRMPTEFDSFSKKADRDYSDCDNEEKTNALILENAMKKQGFIAYSKEWWHFRDGSPET